MRYEIIQSKACHNYDDSQYPNIIFLPKKKEKKRRSKKTMKDYLMMKLSMG
jgi:hypothetical protein